MKGRDSPQELFRQFQDIDVAVRVRQGKRARAVANLAVQGISAHLADGGDGQFAIDAPERSARGQGVTCPLRDSNLDG